MSTLPLRWLLVLALLTPGQVWPRDARDRMDGLEQRINQGLRESAEFQRWTAKAGWRALSLGQLPALVRQGAPALQRSRLASGLATAARERTEALAFDATLKAGVGVSRSETRRRNESDAKYKTATAACTVATCGFNDPSPVYRIYGLDSPIAYLKYDQFRPAGLAQTTIEASPGALTGPTRRQDLSLSVERALPWGAEVALSGQAKRQETHWTVDQEGDNPLFGIYDHPWSSTVTANAWAPLPGAKGFGAAAPRQVAVKQASLGEEGSRWQLAASRDAQLRDALHAYWDLVEAVLTLETTRRHRHQLQQLGGHLQRQLELQRATGYDQVQLEAESARLAGRESAAWQGLLAASHALAERLGWTEGDLLLPVDYQPALAVTLQITLEEALAQGGAHNAGLRAAALDEAVAEVGVEGKENLARPDLAMTAAVTVAQNPTPFGYRTLPESLEGLTGPDRVAVSIGLAYAHPWGNQAAQGQLGQARAQLAESRIAHSERQDGVRHDLEEAYATLSSIRTRGELTRQASALAQASYQQALRLREAGRLTAFESLAQAVAMLDAANRHIQTLVEGKRAEASLQAAMGTLAGGGEGP